MPPPSTLIVSDAPLLSLGLQTFFISDLKAPECHVAIDLNEALPLLQRAPGLVVIANGEISYTPRLVREIRRGRQPPPVIVLDHSLDSDYVKRLMDAGVFGFVSRFDRLDEMRDAVNAVLRGAIHVSPQATGGVRHALSTTPQKELAGSKIHTLSDREMEVFQLVGRGLSGKEIAARLHISVKTVETHKQRMKDKLSLRHATQLAHVAAHHGKTASKAATPA